ncbi:MAG: hypothetical protein Q8J74_03390 [Candidatus Didemnitutus sp.]|nr:hypothetical protein [Candidatus Didemnitutus sp.]
MRILALFLALTVSTAAADVQIVRVFTGWRDAGSFKRISEYFTGVENTGGQIVVRTQPGRRAGYYFLVRTENAGPAVEAKVVVEIVPPGPQRSRSFTFPLRLTPGKAVFNLGVTGEDWPDAEADIVAWKLTISSVAGEILATEKSYLWEKPIEE